MKEDLSLEKVIQADWIAKWALYSPDKIAIKEFESGRTLSYRQLNNLGEHLAHYFTQQFDLKAGDRVAILAENSLAHVALFCAAQKANFTLVPLNYRLAIGEIEYLLNDASPTLLLAEKSFREALETSVATKDIRHHWPWEALADFCDQQKNHPPKDFPTPSIDENDPIFILYTSGTTGFPKGALYTHKMLLWNSINTAISLIVNTESRTLNCMPFFHTGGWNVLLTPFLHHGAYTCLLKKFDAKTVLQLLATEEATLFMGVPTMLKMIAAEEIFSNTPLASLYYIIVGGEPMPIPLIERWHQKGVPIRQGYGMTEVGPNLTSLHQDDAIRKKGSIGRPNFYVQTKIVNENGESVSPQIPGELWLRGPMTTPGYWANPTASQAALTDGWFKTGDRVIQDDEGFLYIIDRIKNMFISGGENVYPAEVERILVRHPAISEVVIIGVAHEKWGEVGKAFIVLNRDMTLNETAILSYCEDKLARFKIPKHFVFLAELPKNDTGKINRKALPQGSGIVDSNFEKP